VPGEGFAAAARPRSTRAPSGGKAIFSCDRRGVPHGYVRARQAAGDPSVIVENKEFGESEPERDERQAEKIAEDTPIRRHERKARRNDRDLRGQTSSWPADIVPRKKAGHLIANPFTTPKNPLSKRGRPHTTAFSMSRHPRDLDM
jgi:hypothetical protein